MPRLGQRNQRLILLEFNELCPHLVEQFMSEALLPNFKRLRDASETFITHTSEEVLEPWIQWVTVHTGVPLSEHGIKDLDEAEKVKHSTFWDGLDKGNVLLMSPMNVKFRRRNQSLFMPDPWAASQAPSEELEPFYKFIRAAVTSHARTDRLDIKDAASAARFLLGHGLAFDTISAALSQLFAERSGRRDVKWRRATNTRSPAMGCFRAFLARIPAATYRNFLLECYGTLPAQILVAPRPIDILVEAGRGGTRDLWQCHPLRLSSARSSDRKGHGPRRHGYGGGPVHRIEPTADA